LTFVILFLGMPLLPNVYDEGIVLTASMRVAAGQLPHRDFYFIYGPAQLYVLAALYRIFGQSILIERLLDVLLRSLVVTSVYAIASSYLRKPLAVCTVLVTLVWLFGLYYGTAGSAAIGISLFNLVSTALIVPVFTRTVSTRRIFAAGAVAGLVALFRHDIGIALLGVHTCVIAIGICTRLNRDRLRAFAYTFWPYLPGFAVVTLPPALYYLSLASLRPLLYDIVVFPSKYYYHARNMPFPRISLRAIEDLAVYVPVVVIGIAAYAVVADRLKARENQPSVQGQFEERRRHGFLVAFGLLTLSMYVKGLIRLGLAQMYLAIIPSLLLTGALYQQRLTFRGPVRVLLMVVVWISLLAPAMYSVGVLKDMHAQHSSIPNRVWRMARRTVPAIQETWCKTSNPATRGICFLPEDYRIRAIEFIDNHTSPNQKLFVGLSRHDKIFVNDNIIYFASHRLPATRWSHFDPDLQTRYDIQVQMVDDLEASQPPYVILDSEFDNVHEPNDSSRSSGVTLMDDYLHKNYRYNQSFGALSIWQRIPGS
jgi:hypothetical protein